MIVTEVVNAQLDYNILPGYRYMYTIKEASSLNFYIMMFPFNMNILALNQVNYYVPYTTTNRKNILPIVW